MRRKHLKYYLAVAVLGLIIYGGYYAWQVAVIGAAYKAKNLCSGVFVSKRSPQDVLREDVGGAMRLIDGEIDYEKKMVTASLPLIRVQRAVYRSQLGCTLVDGDVYEDSFRDDSSVPSKSIVAAYPPQKTSGLRDARASLPQEVSASRLYQTNMTAGKVLLVADQREMP